MITIYTRRAGSNRRAILLVNGAVSSVQPDTHDVRFEAADRDSDTVYVFHVAPDTLKNLARHAESVPSFLSLQGRGFGEQPTPAVNPPAIPPAVSANPANPPPGPIDPPETAEPAVQKDPPAAVERQGDIRGLELSDWQDRTWKTRRGAENAARRASELTETPHTPVFKRQGTNEPDFWIIVPA